MCQALYEVLGTVKKIDVTCNGYTEYPAQVPLGPFGHSCVPLHQLLCAFLPFANYIYGFFKELASSRWSHFAGTGREPGGLYPPSPPCWGSS